MAKTKSLQQAGTSYPLGAHKTSEGWNFSIFSTSQLTSIVIAPYDEPGDLQEIPLDPTENRFGNIWHIFLELPYEKLYYGYKKSQCPVLLNDPYATLLDTGNVFGQSRWNRDRTKNLTPFALCYENEPF